jgi:hypothetical protein
MVLGSRDPGRGVSSILAISSILVYLNIIYWGVMASFSFHR